MVYLGLLNCLWRTIAPPPPPGGAARLGTTICQGNVATTPSPTPVTVAGQVQIANCNTL
ncbi:MAG: hypothetical protein WBG32_02780 [Nodosilinea sp.]